MGEPTGSVNLGPEDLLGHWINSEGSSINVFSTDAYALHLVASVSRPGRPDAQITIRHVDYAGGWICGHSVLEPTMTSLAQLFWVQGAGEVSVWVRPACGALESSDEDD